MCLLGGVGVGVGGGGGVYELRVDRRNSVAADCFLNGFISSHGSPSCDLEPGERVESDYEPSEDVY